MISILNIAVLITAISVVGVPVITRPFGSDPISTDVVTIRSSHVEEEPLVASATLVRHHLHVVERSVASSAGQGVVELDHLQTP